MNSTKFRHADHYKADPNQGGHPGNPGDHCPNSGCDEEPRRHEDHDEAYRDGDTNDQR
jgi:hypothetical protein